MKFRILLGFGILGLASLSATRAAEESPVTSVTSATSEPASTGTATPTPPASEFPRAPATMLEAQIALERLNISSGSLDGKYGTQTRSALIAFQENNALESTGKLDAETLALLRLDSAPLTTRTLTAEDLASLQPIAPTWLGKSQQATLAYATALEMAAEQAHASPALLRQLNPNIDWQRVAVGTVITIPDVSAASRAAVVSVGEKAARIQIHLEHRILQVRAEDGRLLAHFPVSIARDVEKRPVGVIHVKVIVRNPNYTFDPDVFTESEEGRELGRKLIIPPGPNNPVGLVWIGLDLPGYGIHGTPEPENVGRTESHGCFRLANWNALTLADLVDVGTEVNVLP